MQYNKSQCLLCQSIESLLLKVPSLEITQRFTVQETKKGRYKMDIFVCCFLGLSMGLAFGKYCLQLPLRLVAFSSSCSLLTLLGINKPSAQPFLESPKTDDPPGLGASATFYSVVVACYSLGELVGALSFGGPSNKLGTVSD